jgi:hypothetical protein
MKLIKGKQYQVWWVDAAGDAAWQTEDNIDRMIEVYEKGVQQDLYFVKESNLFYAFTSGKHLGDGHYCDVHLIPKAWSKLKQSYDTRQKHRPSTRKKRN